MKNYKFRYNLKKEESCEEKEAVNEPTISSDLKNKCTEIKIKKEKSTHIEKLDYKSLEIKCLEKKIIPVFFLISTSKSMEGTKIGVLNTTMEELIPELRERCNSRIDIKLAVMNFSTDCKWVTEEPMSVEMFPYWKLLKAGGDRNIGAAFIELSKKLSRKEFLSSDIKPYAPIIFLLIDGYSTDDAYAGLEVLNKNKWYKCGLKIALGVGSNFDENLLEKFTGNPELVVTAKTSNQLARLIKPICIDDDIWLD